MDDLDPLILDFLEWLSREPRSHSEVLDAWRTSCPRLTVWEDAVDRGYVTRQAAGNGMEVILTAKGVAFLSAKRAAPHLLPPDISAPRTLEADGAALPRRRVCS